MSEQHDDEPMTVESLFAEALAREPEMVALYAERYGLGADRPALVRLLDQADHALDRDDRDGLIAALEAMRRLVGRDGKEDDEHEEDDDA